ncbi:hypothetical protein SLNSH_16785 [Alsobacter soli]|uniref:TfuA-like core domain-containing protein n=2 Tax=Alsobacter soli TaxID=2109933 RepID=A0A2T1HQC8_9HYPH|nr:hypothetical protein SLNSH_16785 [Alsobacter soli]
MRILPPAAQGDLYRAILDHRPRAVGIVDGYFHQVPSVWHREVLWAMSEGVAVFGAASMGALRAAELCDFGMVGVGRVFEAYRDGRYGSFPELFENDDEVAVLHGPPETGFLRLSDALVDLRQGLIEASDAGVISAALRDRLAAEAAALPYGERSAEALLASPSLEGEAAQALRLWWERGYESQKRRDAIALIARMEAWLSTGEPAPPPSFVFQRAGVWEAFVAGEARRRAETLSPDEQLVIDDLQLDPPAWAALRRAAGREPGGSLAEDARDCLLRWRESRGLRSRPALDAWMAANGLDQAGLAALFERVARRGGAHVTPAGFRDVIDHLRITDRYAAALARARRHAELLSANPDAPPARPSAMSLAERYGVIDASALGAETLERAARRLCYGDASALAQALEMRRKLELAGVADFEREAR